jgi:hypothetical protein
MSVPLHFYNYVVEEKEQDWPTGNQLFSQFLAWSGQYDGITSSYAALPRPAKWPAHITCSPFSCVPSETNMAHMHMHA